MPWGHIYKAPEEKTEVKGKVCLWILTDPENITHFNYYGRLQIQFCLSRCELYSNNGKKQTLGEIGEFLLYLVCLPYW